MASTTIEGESPTAAVSTVGTAQEDAAERRVASLYRPALYFESKQKVLDLVRVFSEHGYLSLEEVASAMDRTSELVVSGEAASLRQRIRRLEGEVQAQRFTNELTAWDRDESELALVNERELVQESLVRIANLEGQLRDARRTTLKLIAASRNGLATLKQVRDHMAAGTYAVGALAPLVQDFRELTQVVQELHALAIVKAATTPLQPVSP